MELVKETVLCLALAGIAGGLVCLAAPKGSDGVIKAIMLAFVICVAAVPYCKGDFSSSSAWQAALTGDFGGGEVFSAFAAEQWKTEAERLIAGEVTTVLNGMGAAGSGVTVMAEMGENGVVYASKICMILDENSAVDAVEAAKIVKEKFGIAPTVCKNES